MIDLYYWPTPNGHKITLMLEELAEAGAGLEYAIRPVNIGQGDQFRAEFLEISPNNKMPAIVDHAPADGGAPLSVFESGAILLYLAEKTGRFLPGDLRGRTCTLEWLFWQMAGLGPMAGQAHHFRIYAPQKIPYAIERYTKEVHRLYGVLNARLADRPYLAGDYSIADIACIGWAKLWERQGQDIKEFPHFAGWLERVLARPAVKRGLALNAEDRTKIDFATDKQAQSVLFGQRPPG